MGLPDYRHELTELYRKRNLTGDLPTTCENRQQCWAACLGRADDHGSRMNQISLPFLGSKYHHGKVICLGINMNEYGGMDAMQELGNEACERVRQGWRRIRFKNSDYHGTFFWHRLPAYTVPFLAAQGLIKDEYDGGYPTSECTAAAFDYICVFNSVKCSPIGDKSEPSAEMFQCCPRHILRHELALLAPKLLIVAGNGNNWRSVAALFDTAPTFQMGSGRVARYTGLLNGARCCTIVVPHPTSRGGNAQTIMEDVRELSGSFTVGSA